MVQRKNADKLVGQPVALQVMQKTPAAVGYCYVSFNIRRND
jgi:hypothetical protein